MERKRYRYDVRYFRMEDHDFHECTGNVVAVLQSAYNIPRKTWYVTVLVQEEVESGAPRGWGGNGGNNTQQDT